MTRAGHIDVPELNAMLAGADAAPAAAIGRRASIRRYLPTRLDVRQRLAVLALIAIVLVLRKPEAFMLPQLIADDALLFRDALTDGLGSIFWPYAGYTLVVPRLAAWLGIAIAPMSDVPLVYSAISLAAILYTCARLMSPRAPVPHAWLAALVIPLLPHDGEVYLHICYIQWTLILTAYAMLTNDAPRNRREYAGDVVTLAMVGLSGPFIFPLVPFYWMRAMRDRSRYRMVLAALATLGGAIQLYTVIATGTLTEHAAGSRVVIDGLIAIGTKLFAVTFMGGWLPYHVPWPVTAVVGIAGAAASLYAFAPVAVSRNRTLLIAFLSGSAFFAVSAIVRVKENALNLVPFDHGDRYFFNPRVLLVWCLLLALTTSRRRLALALLAVIAVSSAMTFRTTPYEYHAWSQWSPSIERREPTQIIVSPYNWHIDVPAKRP